MSRLIGAQYTTGSSPKITTFNSSGTFTSASGSSAAKYLVVGGGAGGGNTSGGGGGAGGFRTSTDNSFPINASTGYPITVGAGGALGERFLKGSNGGDSVFSSITSTGGGGGGGGNTPTANQNGQTGGSGGGACGNLATDRLGGAGNTPPVSPSQGNAGGNEATDPSGPTY